MSIPRHRRTLGAVFLTAVLTLAPLGPARGETPATDDVVGAAVGFLVEHLTREGDRAYVFTEGEFDGQPYAYVDYGLTIDILLAIAGAGLAADEAARIAVFLADPETVAAYTPGFDGNAGAHGKLVTALAAAGVNPRDVADGQDLVALLEARQLTEPADPDLVGLYWAGPSGSEPASGQPVIINQVWPLLALQRTGATTSLGLGVNYLLDQQCDSGAFPAVGGAATCTGDVDATAFALHALVAAGFGPEVGAATAAAAGWLLSQQGADGQLPAGGDTANSTGLAALALELAGETDAAAAARAALLALVHPCDGANPGAIAGDDFDAARATAQALVGLTRIALTEVSTAGASTAVPLLDCPADPEPVAPEETSTPGPATGTDGTAEDEQLPETGAPALLAAVLGAGLLLAGLAILARRPSCPEVS